MTTVIFDIGGVLVHPQGTQFEPIEEGLVLLTECSHLDLYVCTNYHSEVVEFIINQFPEQFANVKAFITPDRAGAKKPNPKIFQFLTNQYPLIAEQTVFIDDSARNVAAAQDAGFVGIHARNSTLVRQQLQELGILPA